MTKTVEMVLNEKTKQEVTKLRERYPSARSAVLPSLWAVQHQFGYLPKEGMEQVASLLGLEPSEVQAVSTFYSMYFQKPAGKHHLLLCTNVSCGLRGSDELAQHLEKTLGCKSGETTGDGEFTWEATVECLGACGKGPSMQVDHHFYEDLTEERLDRILREVKHG